MKTKSALESLRATTKSGAKLPADLAADTPSHFGMSLADHADAWWRERGAEPPPRTDMAWQSYYEEWHAWAFAGIAEPEEDQELLAGARKAARNTKPKN